MFYSTSPFIGHLINLEHTKLVFEGSTALVTIITHPLITVNFLNYQNFDAIYLISFTVYVGICHFAYFDHHNIGVHRL